MNNFNNFNEQQPPQVKITPDMMKNFKTVECDCGGKLFETGIILKKIPALVSPSGKEEIYPLEILVCKKCGKVPSDLNVGEMLPDDVIATQTNLIK